MDCTKTELVHVTSLIVIMVYMVHCLVVCASALSVFMLLLVVFAQWHAIENSGPDIRVLCCRALNGWKHVQQWYSTSVPTATPVAPWSSVKYVSAAPDGVFHHY